MNVARLSSYHLVATLRHAESDAVSAQAPIIIKSNGRQLVFPDCKHTSPHLLSYARSCVISCMPPQSPLYALVVTPTGGTLKRREVVGLKRTVLDVVTIVPFAVILIAPLTPVGHVLIFGFIQRYFPNLFPSQFTERRQALMSKCALPLICVRLAFACSDVSMRPRVEGLVISSVMPVPSDSFVIHGVWRSSDCRLQLSSCKLPPISTCSLENGPGMYRLLTQPETPNFSSLDCMVAWLPSDTSSTPDQHQMPAIAAGRRFNPCARAGTTSCGSSCTRRRSWQAKRSSSGWWRRRRRPSAASARRSTRPASAAPSAWCRPSQRTRR